MLVLVIFFALYSFPVSALVEDAPSRSFPLPVRIDHQYYIKSSILIQCDVRMYNTSFIDFSSEYNGPNETQFKQLVLALKQGDSDKCLALSTSSSNIVGKDREITMAAIDGYQKMLSPLIVGPNFEKLRVSEKFEVGGDTIFIWGLNSSSPLKNGPLRRAFRFSKNHSDSVSWSAKPPDKITSILTSIAQQGAEFPTDYISSIPAQLKYSCPLVPEANEHQVFLCFDGSPYDVNVFENNVTDSNSVVGFYQKAYHTFRDQPTSKFSELYTDQSREKFLEWYSQMEPNMIKAYRNSIIHSKRKVFFALDGDPIFVVFYYDLNSHVSADISKRIRYEYVVRENGLLKLTNFYYIDFLDELLQDQEIFVLPFLRPIAQQSINISTID